MRCPFLREDQVKSCQAAPFRKYIARSLASAADERCSSPEYQGCAAIADRREAHADPSRCPFLQESLVQFCAAAPAATRVPWSQSEDQRCAHDGHRYCEQYLASTGRGTPALRTVTALASAGGAPGHGGGALPEDVYLTRNHMWLNVADDGLLHIGLDGLLAWALGDVDGLRFLTLSGRVRPAVALRIGGIELAIVFDRSLRVAGANTRLRFNLGKLTSDPYGSGWLFEARCDATHGIASHDALTSVTDGLMHGTAASGWMADESRRLATFAHERELASRTPTQPVLNDGGLPVRGFLRQLDRRELSQLIADLLPGGALLPVAS